MDETRMAADTPGMVPVVLEGVHKSYGDLKVLSGISLRVGRGELYGFLGPNGAGKTTAIRVLLGLTSFERGRAEVFGAKAPPRSQIHRVGFVPQEPALYRDLTVRENLDLVADVFGLPRERFADRLESALAFVDLHDKTDTLVRDLSGGMQRRASLAAAVIHDPDLLILDEPTVGVDPELRASLWDEFCALQAQGKSVLITTHYVDEARRCDRVGFLRAGALVAEGPPAQLMETTRTQSLEDAFLAFVRRPREAAR
jgi:ABC-2 type transport system ATP-binding protein